jgi:hypothetical protein
MNTEELNFAYKVRHALNDISDQLPASTTERLAASRRLALHRRKKPGLMAWMPRARLSDLGGTLSAPPTWLGKLGMLLVLLVLAIALNSMVEEARLQRVIETAEMDVAVLSDELPLSAYTDKGFDAYLAKHAD